MGRQRETVGERLRRLREEQGLSQVDVAGPGVTGAYISRIERGERHPSVNAMRVIARNLGVTLAYLETGRELGDAEERELKLSDAELQLRLGSDLAELEPTLRQVLQEATAAGDHEAEVRARIALGLAASHRGDQREAIRRLGSLAARNRISPIGHPEAYAVLGRAYVEIGRGDEGVELFRSCIEAIRADDNENAALFVRFAGYLAAALVDTGNPAAAEEVMAEALEHARELADPYVRIRLHWSQARIAAASGRGQAALANMRKAIALLRTTEDTLQLGRAQLIYGEMLLAEDRLDEASRYFDLAGELLEAGAEVQDRAILLCERSKLEARRHRPAEALELAKRALALIGESDQHERARALWARGEAHAAAGDIEEAIADFEAAYALVRAEHGVHQHEIPILRAWGSALNAAGRTGDAVEILDRAARASQRGSHAVR
jgi:tetratricopeptide (TPR) repeat protein